MNHLINFKPDIHMNELAIILKVREGSAYAKLQSILEESSGLELDLIREGSNPLNLEDDNVPLGFEQIIEKDHTWICINCSRILPNETIMCDEC